MDCGKIERKLFPNGFPQGYIKGFLVTQSEGSLDVTAVYTMLGLGDKGDVSIDVEQIRERSTKKP